MKKTFLSILILGLMSSCVTLPPPSIRTGVIDYEPLVKSGYFVTESNSVGFGYEAKGSIIIVLTGGWKKKKNKQVESSIVKAKDDYYVPTSGKQIYIAPTYEEVFDALKVELQKLGANGIINMKLSHQIDGVQDQFVLTGMAIKKH